MENFYCDSQLLKNITQLYFYYTDVMKYFTYGDLYKAFPYVIFPL